MSVHRSHRLEATSLERAMWPGATLHSAAAMTCSSRRRALAILAVMLFAAGAPSAQQAGEPDLLFVDISKFDDQLASRLSSGSPVVGVGFYESVSPNSFPPRLEKWLKAVEKNGGQIVITPPSTDLTPKSPALLIGLIGSLWASIKAIREIKEERLLQTTEGRDAELVLERNAAGAVVVSRVNFKKATRPG